MTETDTNGRKLLQRGGATSPALWVALLLFSYVALEVASFVGLEALERVRGITYRPADALSDEDRESIEALLAGARSYFVPDADLGWSLRPFGSMGPYRANGQGLRGDREYDSLPAPGVLRVTSFGDSFTHGDEVSNEETWQAAMEAQADSLEVLNFGVPGYGPGQAFLRYQAIGRRFKGEVVLIGFMSENLHRSVNRFRPFYTGARGLPFAKPRFVLRGGGLELIPNPLRSNADYGALLDDPVGVLREIAVDDGHYGSRYYERPLDWSPTVRLASLAIELLPPSPPSEPMFIEGEYNTDTEAFRVTRAILDAFYASVVADGATPVIVLFPNSADIIGRRAGRPAHYRPLMEHFERSGYRYVDLHEAFPADVEVEDLMMDYHYSPLGNGLVAERLLGCVRAVGSGGHASRPTHGSCG